MRPYTELDTARNDATIDLEESTQSIPTLVAGLGEFVASSTHVIGVVIESNAYVDGSAFIGGRTTEHRDDYAVIAVNLHTDKGVRHATQLLIPEERLAEIATSYTLPGHLKRPTNHVDAFIGSIIKGLTGYSEDTDASFSEQAQASTDAFVSSTPLTAPQAETAKLFGEVNISDAQKNVLYRAQQVETMEHVLRFLIARENINLYVKGNVSAGVDYISGTHLLGDALAIVNGNNGFNEHSDPSTNDLLYRGMLAQKSLTSIKDGIVFSGGMYDRHPSPIWPPEAVEAHEAEKRAAEKAKQDRSEQQRLQREAAEGQRRLEIGLHQQATQQEISDLAAQGFMWKGIMPLTPGGRMDSLDNIKRVYAEQYGCNETDVHVIDNTAIYGGTNIQYVPGNVTIYIRNTK